MQELLSNYWIGLLVLGPMAGIFWASFLGQDGRKKRPVKQVDSTQRLDIKGDNNTITQNQNSHNRTEVHHHHHGGESGRGDESFGIGVVILGAALFVGASLSWGFAKYGGPITEALLVLAIFIALMVLGFLAYRFATGGLVDSDLPASIVVLVVVGFNGLAAWMLRESVRPEVVELVSSYASIARFFLDLSAYGKVLLITQALCSLLIALAMAVMLWRTYRLDRGVRSWAFDAFVTLPILGVFPLGLSNSNWAANLALRLIA